MTIARKTRKGGIIIPDSMRFTGAALIRCGGPMELPIYDDGWEKLYIHRDSMGISGIVRARTWEEAYSICEDEFFPAGDEDGNAEMEEIMAMEEGSKERNHLEACWEESYGYRGNGLGMPDGTVSYIYAKDLNGDSLERLTPELARRLGLVLRFKRWEDGKEMEIEFVDGE